MRLKLFIGIGLVLGLNGIANGAFSGSFLSTGTAGLFKNEADLAVGEGTFNGFGYYATMSDRIGIYTNLMNGQGGGEQFLGNSSYNQYFIGTSGKLLKLYDMLNTSFIVELNNNTTSRSITGKIAGTTGTGYLSYDTVGYDDISGLTERAKETNTNEYETRANSFLINNTLSLSDKMTLGLLISRAGNSGTDTRASLARLYASNGAYPFTAGTSPSFTYNYSNGTTTTSESGEFELDRSSPTTRVYAGTRLGLENMALDLYLGADMISSGGDTSVDYSYARTNNTYAINESEKQDASGNTGYTRIALGGRLSKSLLNNRIRTYGSLELGLYTGSAESKNDVSYDLVEKTTGALLTETYTEKVSEKFEWKDGAVSGTSAGLALSAVLQIEDNLQLGLGLGYTRNSLTTEYAYDHDYTYTETYSDGDSYLNDADDYTLVTRNTYVGWKNTRDYISSRINLPVGFVWDVNAKWQIRASAQHNIYVNRYSLAYEESGAETSETVTTYGDNTVVRANGTPTPQSVVSYLYGVPSNSLTSSTTFAYGIGFKPMPNFTIDCNTMFRNFSGSDGQDLFLFDIDWYRSLYLSATFFFGAAPKAAANN